MSKPGAVANFGVFAKSKATKDKNKITADKKAAKRAAIKVSYDHYGQILKYNASAAEGSQLFTSLSPKDDMRRFLLGSVTAGALMLYGGRNAKAGPDACVKAANVYTCTGDQSGGINYNTTGVLTTLNVNTLTQNGDAIYARETGDITINVDTGVFAINGTVGDGIFAYSNGGAGVLVNSTGDITSNSFGGISAGSDGVGVVSITNNGTIQSRDDGIEARSFGGGVTIDSTGDITSSARFGITVQDFSGGAVNINNDGNIQSKLQGIIGRTSGDVRIHSIGNIISNSQRGIDARSSGAGAVNIINDGVIQSYINGIYSHSFGGGVTVNSIGDITSDLASGIFAKDFAAGVVDVTNDGIIQSDLQGIWAESTGGGVTVDSIGDITSTNQHGIYARDNGAGSVYVKSRGNFQGKYEGIVGRSLGGGGVKIDSIGNIVATDDQGIFAQDLAAGAVDVKTVGKIESLQDSIYARSYGGDVKIDSTGDITSDTARGIFAQNTGAGDISVTNDGKIQTQDAGIFARSYTYAGISTGKVTVDSTGDIVSMNSQGIFTKIRGSGDVSVTNDGKIQANLDGIYARSDPYQGGIIGTVMIDSIGDITSDTSRGIFVNSGSGEISVTNDGKIQADDEGISARSLAGKITINSTGDITSTTSTGIHVQSQYSSLIDVTNNSAINSYSDGIYARSEAGAFFSSPGSVTINSTGDIITIKGGGIKVASKQAAIQITSSGNLTTDDEGIGADNGFDHGGNALANVGAISITNNGDITAEQAIDARSSDGAITIVNNGDLTTDDDEGIQADNGFDVYNNPLMNVGNITITHNGTIKAEEEGIDVNSSDGKITITSTGDITSQTDAAIELSSLTGDNDITINSGMVNGFTYAIDFRGGNNNYLLNKGTLIAQSNLVIQGNTGNETIHNHGTVIGNVDLGTGNNIFNNKTTGSFRSGATVKLGGGTLTNEGELTPGGLNTVQTTALTGDLVQTADGNFVVDINQAGAANDKVIITGTANFAGKVTPNIINLTSQSGSFVIADATGGVTLSGAEAVDTATINFGLEVIGNELHLTFQPNAILTLLNGPLTPNQLATVQNLDAITTNGGATPALQNLINILSGLPNEAAILEALDQLHAESYLANLHTTLFSNLDFAKSMLSCAQYEQGTNGHLKEGECYWAKLSGRQFNQDRSKNNIGIDETSFNFTGGIQFAVQPNWYLGLAASYEDTNTDIDTRAKTEGYRAQFGAVLKTQNGGTTFSAGLTGGFGNFDTKRFIDFGGLNLVAEGDQDIHFGSVHARLAHSFDMGGWYARPILDASLTYLELEGLRETGGGAAKLNLSDVDEWYLSLSPSIEFGTEIKHNTDTIIRPFIKAGITYFDKNDISVSTSFNGAPAGVNAFQTSTEFDDLFVDLEVGVNIISGDGYNLKFNYEAHFAEDTQDHSGGVKLGVKF